MSASNDSSFGALLGYAVLMAVIGSFLGFFYLMSFPLVPYRSLAAREAALEKRTDPHVRPSDTYYFEGEPLRNASWQAKRSRFLEGSGEASPLQLAPGEVNAWLEARFRPADPGPGEGGGGLQIRPEVPNLAVVRAGQLYFNLPASVKGYGLDGEVVISARGSFPPGPAPRFALEELYINAARVPLPGLFGQRVINSLLGAYRQSEEYRDILAAWQSVDSAEITEKGLQLVLP